MATPDLVEYIQTTLGELIVTAKKCEMPDIRHSLTDMVIDTGMDLVELEKFQKKELADGQGGITQKEMQKRISREAAKVLFKMRQRMSGIIDQLQDSQDVLQEEIFAIERERRGGHYRLGKELGIDERSPRPVREPRSDAEHLEILREDMRNCEGDDMRRLIGDVINLVTQRQEHAQREAVIGPDFFERGRYKEMLSSTILNSIIQKQKLALDRADGYYLPK